MLKDKNASALKALEKFATTFMADFRFGPLNIVILVMISLIGLTIHLSLYDYNIEIVLTIVGLSLGMAVCFRLAQIWETVLVLTTLFGLVTYIHHRPESMVLVITIVLAGIISPCVQVAYQWEKAVLLRFGKFKGLRGPGVYPIMPIVDKVANYVDQRIRVTDFTAETTLTKDTVPVNVDAIAFWLVWDAEKSVLELEHYEDAVVLSAQTGLRNAIGKHELGELLSNRDRLGEEIRKTLDEKSNAWGITVQSVEIRDINIPPALEDAMSRQAQAERERQSRVILSNAEAEIAEKFAEASVHYRDNPEALHLRAMNMIFEGLKKNSSMIIVPSTAVETMGLGALSGLTALDGTLKQQGSRAGNAFPQADGDQSQGQVRPSLPDGENT
ncbi:MAG: slipin family protein [Desulfobacterales bacterium]